MEQYGFRIVVKIISIIHLVISCIRLFAVVFLLGAIAVENDYHHYDTLPMGFDIYPSTPTLTLWESLLIILVVAFIMSLDIFAAVRLFQASALDITPGEALKFSKFWIWVVAVFTTISAGANIYAVCVHPLTAIHLILMLSFRGTAVYLVWRFIKEVESSMEVTYHRIDTA